MKRITAILLSLIVAVAFMPTAAFAANESVQFELSCTEEAEYTATVCICIIFRNTNWKVLPEL